MWLQELPDRSGGPETEGDLKPAMGPQWLVEVPKVAASPGDASRIIDFMMQIETQLEAAGIKEFELPGWLQPTPTAELAEQWGWQSLQYTPKDFVDHFGEERFAMCVAARAQNGSPPRQHLVFCPQIQNEAPELPQANARWYSIPFPALVAPEIDIAKHAPLYLDSNLMPREPYFWLPDFPRSRPNMILGDPHMRLPSFCPVNPTWFKNYEGVFLPYPDWYLPSQVELSELPPPVLQKYTQALWRRQVLVTTGVQQKILEETQCRICKQMIPLADGFTKRTRHKFRTKVGYKPVCRDCHQAAHLLNLVPSPPEPPSPDSSCNSSQDFQEIPEVELPEVGLP